MSAGDQGEYTEEKEKRKKKEKKKNRQEKQQTCMHYLCKRKLLGLTLCHLAVSRMRSVGHALKDCKTSKCRSHLGTLSPDFVSRS